MLNGKHVILCVDDDTNALEHLRKVLESDSYVVETATNEREGKAKFDAFRPDCVIIDLIMDAADSGTNFSLELKKANCDTPVYLLSAVGSRLQEEIDCASLGLSGVFQKPFNREKLLATLGTALRGDMSPAARVAVFSTRPYDRCHFETANEQFNHELRYFETQLNSHTALLANGFEVVCAFVNDVLDGAVLESLHRRGTRLIALRCAGYNNVDLKKAAELGISVVRVPAYSPYAVAEHTIGLMLALNRKIHRAHARVREGNFSLEGLLGFDMHGRTAGLIGTGKIGQKTANILHGFGCRILAYDPTVNQDLVARGVEYMDLPRLLAESDIISLHCPLTPQTRHLIDKQSIDQMKRGVMLINTSRGALIDTPAVIDALKSGKIGLLGLDVYEEEADLFFEDLSGKVIQDDVFSRLQTFPNVIITGHQGYFTEDALNNIAEITLANIAEFAENGNCANAVSAEVIQK
jgi:D-lactate dehydrogenase